MFLELEQFNRKPHPFDDKNFVAKQAPSLWMVFCIWCRGEQSEKMGLAFSFYLFIYFWLFWVFVSVQGLSLVAASRGHSSSRCAGLSLSRPLLLRSTGSRCAGSVVVAHRPSCSAACGIFPDQGSNPCALHWQANSQPLHHQGSPGLAFSSFKKVSLFFSHYFLQREIISSSLKFS